MPGLLVNAQEGRPQNAILMISASQVAGILGVHHHTQLFLYMFSIDIFFAV
jgi:hypothetical protein